MPAQTQFWDGLAGCIASCLSLALFYPLDLLRFQSQVGLWPPPQGTSRWRLQPLYQGMVTQLQATGISFFLYFYFYNAVRQLLKEKTALPSVLQDFIGSTIAGATNVLLTAPLWNAATIIRSRDSKTVPADTAKAKEPTATAIVAESTKGKRGRSVSPGAANTWAPSSGSSATTAASTATKSPVSTSLFGVVLELARTGGRPALWKGTVASLALIAVPIIQFVVYDLLKRQLVKWDSRTTKFFAIGLAAKLVSTFLTYPIQLVQSIQRANKQKIHTDDEDQEKIDDIVGRNENILQILLKLHRRDGIGALFRGLDYKLVSTCCNTAFLFFFYEWIAAALKGQSAPN